MHISTQKAKIKSKRGSGRDWRIINQQQFRKQMKYAAAYLIIISKAREGNHQNIVRRGFPVSLNIVSSMKRLTNVDTCAN